MTWNRLRLRCGATLVLVSAALAPAQQGPEVLLDLTAGNARVFAGAPGRALAAAAQGGAVATVAGFLRTQGRPQSTIDSLFTESEDRGGNQGVTHYRFEQRVQGLNVYGTYVKAAVNGNGELVHVIDMVANPPERLVVATLTPLDALNNVSRQLYPSQPFSFRQLGVNGNSVEFSSGNGFFHRNPSVKRVAVPLGNGAMQEGFLVETWTQTGNQLHHSIVSASGRVLQAELRTANENYFVYKENPYFTQTVEDGASGGAWLVSGRTAGNQYQFRMSGNNVDAYLDRDNNNQPDASGVARSGPAFGTLIDKGAAPTTVPNQEAAITHLFYSNNVIHDKLFQHGFTEAAKNFQEINSTGSGVGNDSVLAEAQDGGGTNNANFSTPSDGSRPRMQMYLWSTATPSRDGDWDSDVVFHEYGHGLTWRMIGGMSGCMSGAIGEGASDAVAILMNGNDVVGEYSYNNPVGIRRWPYTNYPRTYGQLTNEGVHAGGELFGAIMWRAKEKFEANTILLNQLWDAYVGGMKFIASGPKYENMRDGIVQAAGGIPSTNGCLVYRAFAEYGVGQGAVGSCSVSGLGPFATTKWNNTQSFAVPSSCPAEGTSNAAPTASFTAICSGAKCDFNASGSTDSDGTITGYAWNFGDGTGGSGVAPSRTYGASATYSVKLTVTDDKGATGEQTQAVTVTVPSGGITLSVRGYKVKGLQKADLSWSGISTSPSVDIYRNTVILRGLTNSGTYTDNIDKNGSGSYTYKVCAAGLDTCSNNVTIVF